MSQTCYGQVATTQTTQPVDASWFSLFAESLEEQTSIGVLIPLHEVTGAA